MITYCTVFLFLVLGQSAFSRECSSSRDIHSAIDELSSQLDAVVLEQAQSYETGNTGVVSSSLLQLVLLQRVINGYGDSNIVASRPPCNGSVQEILEKLDNISSSVRVPEAVRDERENGSAIESLAAEVRETKEAVRMLLEVVDSFGRAMESLTAQVNGSLAQIQRCPVAQDEDSVIVPRSCQQIKSLHPDSPSGRYNITSGGNDEQSHTVYCNMEDLCGSGDGWTRVAYLNMTDPDERCPGTFSQHRYQDGLTVCRRRSNYDRLCVTVASFSSYNINYTEICGRVTGYQYNRPDGFQTYSNDTNSDVFNYVDGVSLTYGSPRKHIWTFAAGESENSPECPCAGWTQANEVPDDVGDHYFCESGTSEIPSATLYTADPLWDGRDCNGRESPCCASPRFTPPWFYRVLDKPTSDNIDMRTCFNFSAEDTPLVLYELYVK